MSRTTRTAAVPILAAALLLGTAGTAFAIPVEDDDEPGLPPNQAPNAALTVSPNPALVSQLLPVATISRVLAVENVLNRGAVSFNASASSDPDGVIVKYDWDLDGNGTFESTTGAVATRSHTYPNPGSFAVGVRVTDNDGGTRTATVPLWVASPGGAGSGGSGGSGSGGSGGSGAGGSGSGGSGGGAAARFAARLTGAPIQRLRAVLARGLALGCRADRAATCSLRAELRGSDAWRLGLRVRGRKPFALGRITIALSRSGTRSARLTLTRAGRRALRRARSVALVVRGTAAARVGGRLTLTRTFLLRR